MRTIKSVSSPECWHQLEPERVFESLETMPQGLSRQEAGRRLVEYGPNRLPDTGTRGSLLRFLSQFHNVLIYVLIVASAVTAVLGHWVDASVILGVVFLNAAIGFVQEGKAENALRAIRRMLTQKAMVMRDGRQMGLWTE